jgi:3-deoxy-manno-octulosonate cytidylyltransferase (CMP-KDO synthetase)
MLQHVFERARRSGAETVVVATDDERIRDAAEAFGARVCMTSAGHRSGTERLAEVVGRLAYPEDAIVVNLQGDEPLMPPSLIAQVAADLDIYPEAAVASLWTAITRVDEVLNPHVVKVVMNAQGYALYFSRAPIPWDRAAFPPKDGYAVSVGAFRRHLGLYAYRAGFLRVFKDLPGCPLEDLEALEQLRVLWAGEKIHMTQAREHCPAGVDTEEDLARVEQVLKA